jgi:hypothetical protein
VVLSGVPSTEQFERNAIMTETVITFPRSRERLAKLIREIVYDVVTIDTTLDDAFDRCSPEQIDEVTRRLQLIQTEVESLTDFLSRKEAGWITG